MGSFSLISLFTLSLFCCSYLIHAQQPYVGRKTTDCTNPDTSDSVLGYTCNGLNRSCQSYLIFRSQPSFNTVASISNLLSSDPSQIAEINEVSETASFETNQMVIVPVNCSCSGDYYQVNTTYTVQSGDGYFSIANNTFQALSTCQAIQNQQPDIPSQSLTIGLRITVPLRCACPTKNQTDAGINYLLSYLIAEGDSVPGISQLFGADTAKTLEANELSDPTINFFTTLLVPLQDPPSKITVPSPPAPPPSSPPPPPPPPSGSSNKTWIYILVGVLGGGALILVVGAVIFCVFFRKSKKKPDLIITSESFEAHGKPLKKKLDDESQDVLDSMSNIAQSLNLKLYKFEELQVATDNFSPSCQIKGSVYCGVIKGDFAAIKKVHGDVSKEIELLNKVNHSNLIRLSGVCFQDGHWYLVYEYAVNGALSDWIFHNDNSGKYLSWKQRIQIALDVATGLNYLHSFTNPPHVHKDLKCSNVLLDGDFRAKIANFALARATEGREGQFALTRHIVGTKGYMAPEYVENGFVSTKLDVYAFGVLLLEIITGKEAAAFYGEEYMNLSDILSNVLHEKDGQESLKHFIDPFMLENYPSELAILVVKLINTCLKKDPTARPAMHEIVQSLSRILTTSSRDSSRNMSWSQASSGSY
ncbi:Kinase family protein / peptidoglycan-binding LysM domain-containing protein, putative [Theobroma cacao]|uniref:Kinase family protein / peptidoglycan-binding LysM domain-containing protein, putative n=1 Tax=Theobroma cacao TaxID=3641 RepID=A0A061DFY3_THECC|nr:Kinase family protein / peptidoglycan-binding LysM domain-containing protein, putative [Theobroma cacao]